MNKRWITLCALACLGMGSVVAADSSTTNSGTTRIATGIEYSSGTYGGTEDIIETYVPVSVSFNGARLSARLTVPFLKVEGPFVTLADTGEEIVAIGTDSGLGDVLASLTVYDVVYSDSHDIALDLTGKVKFGTADPDKNLGTGENDYSVLADVYKFFDRVTLMGTLGYKFRGDPAGLDLNDVIIGSAGGLCDCAKRTRFGLFYDFREASLTDGDEVRELMLFASRDLNHAWQLQYFVFKGFTDSGPEWGAGLQLGVNLQRPRTRERL